MVRTYYTPLIQICQDINEQNMDNIFTIFSRMSMTLLLRRPSGVTMLEKSSKGSKTGYSEYVETTHALISWFPHESSS